MENIIAFIRQHYDYIGLGLIVVSWLLHIILDLQYERAKIGYLVLFILGMLAGTILCIGKGIAIWPAVLVVIGMGLGNIVCFIVVSFILSMFASDF
jgi:hypothetical protein